MARYHFSFISTYRGESDFGVYDRETRAEFRLHMNCDESTVRRLCGDPIASDLLAAFNEWRREKKEADIAELTRRYGAESVANIKPFQPVTISAE